MFKLRPYQQQALEKIKWAMTLEGNDVVQIPTGGGKSLVIAEVANYLQKDILILQPSVEILEQNRAKLLQYVHEGETSVYSASLGEKEINKYTFATIGSIYKLAEDFAHFDLWLLDELHLLNPKSTGSMFGKLIKEVNYIRERTNRPPVKIIGFTATPYRIFPTYFKGQDPRTGEWGLYQSNSIKVVTRLKEKFWARILYSIDAGDLIKQGYLSPLEYVDKTKIRQDLVPLNKGRTDFDMDAYDQIVQKMDVDIVNLVRGAALQHKAVLVFCNSIAQSQRLSAHFGDQSRSVSSKSKPKERAEIIGGFKDGKYKIVFNVGVLTTGFDFPELDAIVLLRPTRSVALYYQMLGRGTRLSPGKKCCTVYDWSDSVKRIGKLETIRLAKVENKWNIVTETKPEGWHGIELYKFVVKTLEG
jgi:DNA repair protein RadD